MHTGRCITPRHVTAHLGVLAVLVHVMLTALHAPMGLFPSDGVQRSGLHAVELCTPRGITVVTVDADGNPVEGPETPRGGPPCPVCTLLAGMVVSPPAGPVIPIRMGYASSRTVLPLVSFALRDPLARAAHRPRGPPSVVSA